jgi:hypothetical protein
MFRFFGFWVAELFVSLLLFVPAVPSQIKGTASISNTVTFDPMANHDSSIFTP